MTITADHFNKYLSQGYSVFPVKLTQNGSKWDKKPCVDWKEFSSRYATKEEVDVWISMLDFNAIGMATGKLSGVLVVDVDDVTQTYGFDSTTKVKTISGGTHLWYEYQEGVKNTVKIGGKPVDIRGEGGFVVVPPSSVSEQKYSFLCYSTMLPKLPALEESREKTTLSTVLENGALPKAGEGERNQTAIRVAGHLVHNTKPYAYETSAWPAFQAWNASHVTPPLPDWELRRTFDSAVVMEKQNHVVAPADIKIYYGDTLTSAYDTAMKAWGNGIETGYQLLDSYFTFQPEHLYLLSAQTFVGKTTLSLNIAARVAKQGKNVLFCSLEQGIYIEPKVRSILNSSIPPTFGMLDSSGMLSVQELLEQVKSLPKVDLVVIDHLHFLKKDIARGITGAMDELMLHVQTASKQLSIPFLVMAHLRKLNGKDQPDLDDLRDSSSLSQIPSVILQLSRKTDPDTGSMNDDGLLHIRKNRITGKTGNLGFTIHPTTSKISLSLPVTEYEQVLAR